MHALRWINVTTAIISAERIGGGQFLDFAGGYGTLTWLMRDRGLDFRHLDPLCANMFAVGHELEPVARSSDVLLMTTQVLPEPAPRPGDWDYFAPEGGQHVTFYTVVGLRALADRLGMGLTTSGRLVHVFHRRPLRWSTRALLKDERLAYVVGALRSEVDRRHGLILADRDSAAASLQAHRRDSSKQPDQSGASSGESGV